MVISSEQLKRIMAQFTHDTIQRDLYNKMPYDTWRDIKRVLDRGTNYFVIEFLNEKSVLIKFNCLNDSRVCYKFETTDKSFGQFLYDLFWDETKHRAHVCTNDYLDTMLNDVLICNSDKATSNDVTDLNGTVAYSNSLPASKNNITAKQTNYNYYNDLIVSNGWDNCINTTSTSTGSVTISAKIPTESDIEKKVEEVLNKRKENEKMKFGNFDFGPVKDNDAIRMSPYGIAVKNASGTYQAYDKANGEMMDVDIINFKADNMFFKIPVAIDNVGVGDVVIHNRKPMVVFGFSDQGDIVAVDIAVGEKKTIMPAKSPFGFNFITKIVSLFDNMTSNTQPDTQHPFGNMLPFMLMGDQSEDFDPMLMCMMTQGQNGCANMFSNPMMMYFLISNKESSSDMKSTLMAMMAMSMMSNPQK